MCGRYELHAHPAAIALAFGLASPPSLAPRYNIAPMQDVPIVRVNAQGVRELVMMRWGLVPRWARDPSIAARMVNARGETVKDKPAFRTAYRRHRCLLPASGFYEWMPREGGKQPVRVAMLDGRPFALAGIADRWLGPDGEPLDTCTIVTTDANELLKPVHERMPVIVPEDGFARWLDPAVADPSELIASFPSAGMRWTPVSTKVNSVRNDDASLIDPVGAPEATREIGPPGEPPPPPRKAPKQSALF